MKRRARRLKAFIIASYFVLLSKFWCAYDWQYVGGSPVGWWKGRLNLIIKDKDFIL